MNERLSESHGCGIYAVRSMDGENLEVRLPAILPGKGDRCCLTYDPPADEYIFVTRPYYGFIPGLSPDSMGEQVRHRLVRMWKSRDLVNWKDYGVVLRHDEYDRGELRAQIYAFNPFRYGKGFLGFVEVYLTEIERLPVQLASSSDGVNWCRVGRREEVLPLGAEGSWDSHWISTAFSPPIPAGDRLRVYYTGSNTKHASGLRHRRALGLATIRRDGWVSLEAGRAEGAVVTREMPLAEPMKLELNVDCYNGYVAADIISAAGDTFEPVPGYDAEASRAEYIDSVCHPVRWGLKEVVGPIDGGKCFLRLTLKQGSLFSYRWFRA